MPLKGWKLILNRLCFGRVRYLLGIMGLLALANAFTMRVCLSMTITQMVKHPVDSVIADDETCHYPNDEHKPEKNTTHRNEDNLFDWNEATQGFLLSSFYYGYLITHVPGGLLAEKYGGKLTLGIGLLITAIATVVTPWVVKAGGAAGLIIVRIIEGCGEGVVTPAFILIMARWVPPHERSRFGSMIFGGAQVGNIFGPLISGFLLDSGDWDNVFYFFGGMGILWVSFWMILCYDTPNVHPFISDEERKYLNETVTASGLRRKLDPVPFKALLRSVPLWVLIIASAGYDWCFFTLNTDLPLYFSSVLKFDIKRTGALSALPYIVMYVSSLAFGALCDFGIQSKWYKIGTGRKIFATIATSIPAVFLILASYSGCDRLAAVCLFVVCMGFMGSFYSSLKINCMDIAPNYAGTCSGFVNGFGAVTGIITPYLIGLITPDQTVQQWRTAFWVVFALSLSTNIGYLIWGSGEEQWWDDVDKYGYPENWKHGALKKRQAQETNTATEPK